MITQSITLPIEKKPFSDFLTNEFFPVLLYNQRHEIAKEYKLENRQVLNQFFTQVERRAFKMAALATSNDDIALDIVQDAMFALARNYADKSQNEWGPLFHRILQSKIRDWYRRNSVRNRIMSWLHIDDEQTDPMQQMPDTQSHSPEQHTTQHDSMQSAMQAISLLPLRQQQCFLLRAWEGYSVRDTAEIMVCSEGSVKTHYSRAIKALKTSLKDFNDAQ